MTFIQLECKTFRTQADLYCRSLQRPPQDRSSLSVWDPYVLEQPITLMNKLVDFQLLSRGGKITSGKSSAKMSVSM